MFGAPRLTNCSALYENNTMKTHDAAKPKPMTSDRRAEIEAHIGATSADLYTDDITDLLADAAYWREAVRTADFAYIDARCPWCSVSMFAMDGSENAHKPDCVWLRAQL